MSDAQKKLEAQTREMIEKVSRDFAMALRTQESADTSELLKQLFIIQNKLTDIHTALVDLSR